MQIKSFTAVSAFALMCAIAAGSSANANMIYDFYVGGTAGFGGAAVFNGDDTYSHSAQSYGAVAGLDIPLLRIELEYNYLTAGGGDNVMQVGLLDAYLKMPTSMLQPYIGAGVGWLFSGHIDDVKTETTATYQAMLGLSVNTMILPLSIDIEGRAMYVPDVIQLADNKTPDVMHYEGRVKLRYVF